MEEHSRIDDHTEVFRELQEKKNFFFCFLFARWPKEKEATFTNLPH